MMVFKKHFLQNYIAQAPLALALERTYECALLSKCTWERPILDLGCGDGIFASVLCAEPIDTGIDLDSKALEQAKLHHAYRELLCCDASCVPKKDGEFKTIISNSVLEHIKPIEQVLKEAHRLLAVDGRMFVTVPTDRFDEFTVTYQVLSGYGLHQAAQRFRHWFNRFWKHHHHYDCAGWEKIFAASGWRVVKSREYNPKASAILHDALVPLSVGSFLAHRLFNRWFICPPLRDYYSPIMAAFFKSTFERHYSIQDNGGLIFFELRKA